MTCKILHYNEKKNYLLYNGMQSCAYGKRIWYTYMECVYGKHFLYVYMVSVYGYMVCIYK